MALAAMVAVSLFVRSHQDAEEAEGREQTDDHQAARQEDNQVIDYHLLTSSLKKHVFYN